MVGMSLRWFVWVGGCTVQMSEKELHEAIEQLALRKAAEDAQRVAKKEAIEQLALVFKTMYASEDTTDTDNDTTDNDTTDTYEDTTDTD